MGIRNDFLKINFRPPFFSPRCHSKRETSRVYQKIIPAISILVQRGQQISGGDNRKRTSAWWRFLLNLIIVHKIPGLSRGIPDFPRRVETCTRRAELVKTYREKRCSFCPSCPTCAPAGRAQGRDPCCRGRRRTHSWTDTWCSSCAVWIRHCQMIQCSGSNWSPSTSSPLWPVNV